MPPAKQTKPSRRVQQCVYVEGDRRCRRSGAGNPAVCQLHKIAFEEAGRRASQRRPGDGIWDLFDRFMSGDKINRKVVQDAFDDLADIASTGGGFHPPDGFTPPPGWNPRSARPQPQARQPPPPPPDATLKKKRLAARLTLGFAPSEPITLEIVQKRRRELARKYHPDRPGGSLAKMQTINNAADVLEAQLSPPKAAPKS